MDQRWSQPLIVKLKSKSSGSEGIFAFKTLTKVSGSLGWLGAGCAPSCSSLGSWEAPGSRREFPHRGCTPNHLLAAACRKWGTLLPLGLGFPNSKRKHFTFSGCSVSQASLRTTLSDNSS